MRKKLYLLFFFFFFAFFCSANGNNTIKANFQNGINIIVQVNVFDMKKHKFQYCGDYLCLIDQKPFFGTDGKMPQKYLEALIFEMNGTQIPLEVTGMYEPLINKENIKNKISVSHHWGDVFKVRAMFSDGAGSYIAEWLIIKNESTRTHISDLESLFDLNKHFKN